MQATANTGAPTLGALPREPGRRFGTGIALGVSEQIVGRIRLRIENLDELRRLEQETPWNTRLHPSITMRALANVADVACGAVAGTTSLKCHLTDATRHHQRRQDL